MMENQTADRGGTDLRLKLFIAGDEPNSRIARKNLADVCETDLQGRCRVEVIDIFSDVEAAMRHGILLTPTLLVMGGDPPGCVIGNLSDRQKLRGALGLEKETS